MQEKIIIVDDEESILFSMRLALKMAGYEVTTAKDGREGLEKILATRDTSEQFDLLIADIQMPNLTGLELLDELHKENIFIPTIIITGFGDKEIVVQLLRKGCTDYLDKPFESDELVHRVNTYMQKHKKSSTIEQAVAVEPSVEPLRGDELGMVDKDGRYTIVPPGDIISDLADKIRVMLVENLDKGFSSYRFDFRNVHDIDSVGLSIFLCLGRMLGGEEARECLEIVNADKEMMGFFHKTGIDEFYHVH